MGVYVAALQPSLSQEDYRSAQALKEHLHGLFERALAERPPGMEAVVVLPEEVGSFLPLALLPRGSSPRSVEEGVRLALRSRMGRVLAVGFRYRPTSLAQAAHLALAPEVWRLYQEVMSHLARYHRVYLVAGSVLLPEGTARDGVSPLVPRDRRVYNRCYVFGPHGEGILSVGKANLVPTVEDHLGLSPAPPQVGTFRVGGLRFAPLICYDAFVRPHTRQEPHFVPLAPLADEQGVDVLLQPSANPWPWEGRWALGEEGDTRTRRQQWAEEGVEAALAGCRKARYAATSHLCLHFMGQRFEGEAAIFARTREGVRCLRRSGVFRPEDGDGFAAAVLEDHPKDTGA